MLNITQCPTCGSKKIAKVCRDFTEAFEGQEYTVPELEFYECPDCGEQLYDREAMRKIETYSPSYAKKKMKKAA